VRKHQLGVEEGEMKEKAIHVIWRSIKALKDIIVECGEVPGTQKGDEYVNTFRSSTNV
jgi:hypothetical protein